MTRPCCLVALLLGMASPAFGQGRIAGTVQDERGEPLIGVNVVVLGTANGAATDLYGRYEINGLRAGQYNVQLTYIGFETKLFTAIPVRPGETTRLDVTLAEAVLSTEDEVVIVGERPLLDVEQASSSYALNAEQLSAAPIRDVQAAISTQAGVIRDPTGLYIRGGRSDETALVVDGVSAKDPLAGTGFGLDLGTNAFREVEVTTGGGGAEFGEVTSGIVAVTTQDGSDTFAGTFSHQRDDLGFNRNAASNFREEVYELTLGGPLVRGALRFFVSGQAQLADGFTRAVSNPDQLRSSLVGSTFWMPRAANRWNGLGKLTWDLRPGLRLQGAYQRSLTLNQNTRMLQVTGNEALIQPGFQYGFILQPDNANTYTHDNIIVYGKLSQVLTVRSFYEVQLSRLFTRLRADANGRTWRPANVDTELDPASIVTWPATVFVDENGQPSDPNALFILPGPGLVNNGGLATRWHDHFAEEITLRGSYTRFSESKNSRLQVGFEVRRNDYQWIDVIRPWVGAPIGAGEGTSRLGESADLWRVQPRRGAVFATQQLRYRGLIANLGARLEAWSPGQYVDALVEQALAFYAAETPNPALPRIPILENVARAYRADTVPLLGLRTKLRLLPKVRVSFPIQDNRVLFFNYGHSTRTPHPTFVYAGLDPFFQDRSFFADLGNPNLDPEVDISYEIGLRNQFSGNDVLNVSAFWRDKFDFITVEDVVIPDATGRETVRAFRVNGDFARVRGLEASYLKRIGQWFQGQLSAGFSRATGLSSTNNDALVQFLARGDIDNTAETPLAWDRPLDLKGSVTLRHDARRPWKGIPGLNRIQVYLSTTFRSGQRYTPVTFQGREVNPFTGEADWRPIYTTVSDPTKRFSALGDPWWWFDLSLQRRVRLGPSDLQLTLEVTNLFNQRNSVIINPVTGTAYPDVAPDADFTRLRDNPAYDVPTGTRDLRYEDPSSSGLPPLNPARFLPQRHLMLGLSYQF